MSVDAYERLRAPGHSGEERQAGELAATIFHESLLEVQGGQPAPDLRSKLMQQLRDHRKE